MTDAGDSHEILNLSFSEKKKIKMSSAVVVISALRIIILNSYGYGTQAINQSHKSVNERRIRMFRPTDMDPRIKGVVRRPRSKRLSLSYTCHE